MSLLAKASSLQDRRPANSARGNGRRGAHNSGALTSATLHTSCASAAQRRERLSWRGLVHWHRVQRAQRFNAAAFTR
jgi:hypothetical protein